MQALRQLGFAARFVSGYLIQLVADVKPLDGPAGPTADFTDLHAWAEVYLPGAGWVGLDATSGLLAGEGHIPLAATPDPLSAAPITGAGGEKRDRIRLRHVGARACARRRASPSRTPKSSGRTSWPTGAAVDRALPAGDVRLTMGGEPTFVAATDLEAPEWNTDALGPTKRRLRRPADAPPARRSGRRAPRCRRHRQAVSRRAAAALGAACASGARDGEPVWRDPALLAADDDADSATADGCGAVRAALAERLQVDPGASYPAYEDIHYYLWREHRLPANVVAEDNKLRTRWSARGWRACSARARRAVSAACCHCAVPCTTACGAGRAGNGSSAATRCSWSPATRRSAIGCRSMPALGGPRHIETDSSPIRSRRARPLPPRQSFRAAAASRLHSARRSDGFRPVAQDLPMVGSEEPDVVRTALAVEPRDGMLHIFFPPLYAAEDWLELAAAVEDIAGELGRKVVLEGYLPPRDPGLLHFSVTPDPGVIEVNVHPAANWAEIVERTEHLYEEARQVGLATEKFMLDGRHIGTGGGNHVVMGAAERRGQPVPAASRSAEVAARLLAQPSRACRSCSAGCSSGRPASTRASTRRARTVLHELEIAFAQIVPKHETSALADRPAVPQSCWPT